MRFLFSLFIVLTVSAASANHGEDTPNKTGTDEHALDDQSGTPRRFGVAREKNPPDATLLNKDTQPIQIKLGQLGKTVVVPNEEEFYQNWPQYEGGIPDACKRTKDVVCCSVAVFYPPKNPQVELPFGKQLPVTKIRTKAEDVAGEDAIKIGKYRLEAKLSFKIDGTNSAFMRCETYSDTKHDLTIGDIRKAFGFLIVVEPKS